MQIVLKKMPDECKMKKFVKMIFALVAICGAGIFTSCGEKNKAPEAKEKIKIVAETFPIYDWIKNIAGDKCDVELLINSGTDLHSWQPAAKDILTLTGKETDLFVFLGGESDFWVRKLMAQMDANGVQRFSIMESNLVLLEPMGVHDHHHHGEAENDEDAHESEDAVEEHDEGFDPDEYDEHIWLSLKRVPAFVNSIAEKVAELDPENADFYFENATSYAEKIDGLYKEAMAVVENSPCKTIVIADRNPFVYLECDLGLETFAAFHGCSSDTEASFDVILGLQKKVEEKKLSSIVCSDAENRLAQTIAENIKSKKLNIKTLNSMQTKISDGETYYSIMKWNVEQLKEILGE